MPVKYIAYLGMDRRAALAEAKNEIKQRGVKAGKAFDNEYGRNKFDGSPLPKVDLGCCYREFKAGLANGSDSRIAGVCRFFFQIHVSTGKFSDIYFTDEHYSKENCCLLI